MVELTQAQLLRGRGPSRPKDLASVKNLNLWGQNLTNVSILSRAPNLEVLSLAINSLTSLSAFQGLSKLVELYLRRNNISEPRELQYLQNLPNLRVLWLSENPIADLPDYRRMVLRVLPQLRKLDDRDVTEEERREAQREQAGSYPLQRDGMQTAFRVDKPPPSQGARKLPAIASPHPSSAAPVKQLPFIASPRSVSPAPPTKQLPFVASPRSQSPPPFSTKQLPSIQSPRSSSPAPVKTTNRARTPREGMQPKRRPSWLTHSEETGQVKEKIRAASLDAQVAENDAYSVQQLEPRKTKTNNILFAVLSLIKELDTPSLQVVGHELAQTLKERL